MANKIVWDYELMERAGAGGFGITFKAHHIHLPGRTRAVKLPQAPYIAPFKESREALARIAQALDEAPPDEWERARHLVRIETFRCDLDEPYLVMEWVEGGTLRDRISQGPLPLKEATDILVGVLDGLSYAHSRGLVHSDLKPSNILLTPDGTAKLTDFGGTFTGENVHPPAGSLPYLSPEQLDRSLLGDSPLDRRADLFSLTLVLYELLTGRRAPRVITGAQMPSKANSRVPAAFDDLIARGLEADREARFQDAAAMRDLVRQAAGLAETVAGAVAPMAAGPEPAEVEEAPAAPIERRAGEARVNDTDRADMVWMPAGTLHMGCEGRENEEPVHDVEVKGLWLYKRPVTHEQYLKYLQSTVPAGERYKKPGWFKSGDRFAKVPVAGATWEEAMAYCRWVGGRLPTEPEWEWAARGPSGYTYPWGNSWSEGRANTKESGQFQPVEASSSGNSWCDAEDMAGNVFEWCSSLFQPYPYAADDGREDPQAPGPRVLRGGSANTDAECARATYRCAPNPQARLTGFRPVRDE